MTLPTPQLDDRTFQQIVNEAKSRIAQLCPAWTDHNVSDPGVTLIELFAWMVEMLLYRLNRVPEKSYITFMELMGVRLEAPQPARTDLTFWLNEAARETLVIPTGTEVATKQTSAAEPAITFSADRELQIRPPEIAAYLTSADDGRSFVEHALADDRVHFAQALRSADTGILIFSPQPQVDSDGLYIVFRRDVSGYTLELKLDCVRQAAGIQVQDPPLAWQVWCSGGWRDVEWLDGALDASRAEKIEHSGTNGLNDPGTVTLHLPQGLALHERQGFAGYWVRCIYRKRTTEQKGYGVSPRVRAIEISTIGATVSATQAMTIGVSPDSTSVGEVLGYSDGSPGQRFQLQYHPVLPLGPDEQIQVADGNGGSQVWEHAPHPHFGYSQGKRHFLLDRASGVIQFGPLIREPDGTETQYGEIPPRGSQIRITRYRCGGGARGNLPPGKITEPKRTLAFVRSVTNRRAASGGRDGESLERAKLRAPMTLHAVTRAVTPSDYERLALEADPRGRVVRARCIAPRRAEEGADSPVTLLLVAANRDDSGRLIVAKELDPELHDIVSAYLNDRRLLASKLEIKGPTFRMVSIMARIKARQGADPQTVRQRAEQRLDVFLNPLHGADGSGWPFGRGVYISEIYSLLQATPGMSYVEKLAVRSGEDELVEGVLNIGEHELIAPGDHKIIVA